jgi:HEAT repeat protein
MTLTPRTRIAALAALLPAFLAISAAASAQPKIQVVDSSLTKELVKIFPEAASGYIDFNGNGKPDSGGDLNETIPESRVKDGQLQAQEILDFVVANWRFSPAAKLRSAQAAVKSTSGAIDELIAIDFSSALDEAIRQREAMGDLLYLTPSAYKEAMGRMGGYVSAMAEAYRKEGQKNDAAFLAARDGLFGMIEKGYPLPTDLPDDERATLSTAMVSIVVNSAKTNPARTRSAIQTLGRLKSAEAAPYLLDLASGGDYAADAIRALGDIGYKPAIPALSKLLKSGTSPELRKASLQAAGAIGGTEGLDAILDLVKPANRASLPADLLEAAVQALAGIAQKGNPDPRIQAALKEFATAQSPALRKSASAGLGAFTGAASVESLLAVLGSDKDVAVRMSAVDPLNRQKNELVVPAFIKVLKERDLDPALEIAVLRALGDNPNGAAAVAPIVDDLADKDPGVRAAASTALRKLYPANQTLVVGSITRSLAASQDENFLVDGTALLAALADKTSVASLLALLGKPLPEVRRNAAWALYRIADPSNPKVVEELAKLITNENETIAVRVCATRAVGAIGLDNGQLNLWQTLVTTAQMRGEKYAMLRLFAVRSLGQLGAAKPQVVSALTRIASRDPDVELRKEAVTALKALPQAAEEISTALAASMGQAEDTELKVRIIEAIADLGSSAGPGIASDFLASPAPAALKRRVVCALSQDPSEASAAAILDAAKDPQLMDYAASVLEAYPRSLMASVVPRRLRTETDKNVISVLSSLQSQLE